MKDANITVAGSTRDQATTIGNILIDTALSQGCAVFAWHEDEPQCVGGRNFHHIRISDMPVDGPFFQADVLADIESTGQWAVTTLDNIYSSGRKEFPTKDQIETHQIAGGIVANAEVLGAVTAVIGIDFYTLIRRLSRHFTQIGNEAISGVQAAAERGFAIAAGKSKSVLKYRLPVKKQRFIGFTGNDAIALGAAYAGCRYIYAFPMTPPNRLVTFLEKQESWFGRFARQIECALAPVYSAIDDKIKKTKPKTVQQRARIAWSAEDIFLPCLADTPVVIVLGHRPGSICSQRPGVHTDDSLLGICAGKGKTARMVLTPQNAEDAFYKTILSFQLADIYHAPVIISAEPMVAESFFSIGEIDPWRQSLFAYLSEPAKIKYRMATKNIPLKPINSGKVLGV
jgi:2-oxoglutarate/2-oxoacid ferredoxin oxidoreductase subunit alpha